MTNTKETSNDAPRTKRWLRKRSQIVRAAEKIFADKGYDGTRLEDISNFLEMQRPSLVYYFDSKADLLDAVIADITKDMSERIEESLNSPDIPNKLSHTLSALTDYFLERPTSALVMIRQAIDPQFPQSQSSSRASSSIITMIKNQGALEHLEMGEEELVYHWFSQVFFSAIWVAIRDATLRSTGYDLLSQDGVSYLRRVMADLSSELVGATRSTLPEQPCAKGPDGGTAAQPTR